VSKKDITASQAKGFLASVRPCDVAGRTWRRTAVEHLTLLVTLDKKVRPSTEELKFSALLRPGDPQVRSPTWVDGPSQELYIDPDPQAAAHQHDRLAAILQVTLVHGPSNLSTVRRSAPLPTQLVRPPTGLRRHAQQ
jgi:hypothetical protein